MLCTLYFASPCSCATWCCVSPPLECIFFFFFFLTQKETRRSRRTQRKHRAGQHIPFAGASSGDSTTHLQRSAVMSGTGIHRLIYRDIYYMWRSRYVHLLSTSCCCCSQHTPRSRYVHLLSTCCCSPIPIHAPPINILLLTTHPPIPGGGNVTDRESNPRPLGTSSGDSTTHLERSAVMNSSGIHRVGGWVSPCAVSPLCCFPPVVFAPCGVWLGLCVGRVDPALAFIRWQLGMISPRASARQTRAGRRLAAAGAPQLHSPAPPQQTRRQARRPADNMVSGHRQPLQTWAACRLRNLLRQGSLGTSRSIHSRPIRSRPPAPPDSKR